MSGEYAVYNMLRGTADLSGCHYPTDKISVSQDPGLGFAVARLTPTTTGGGLVFKSQDVPESERVSGAAFCLSFLARADVAGDRIHSEVWGSRYMLDATLGTGWRLVTMPYGFVNAKYPQVFFNGVAGNSGAVYLALPMANRGTTPAAWAPAEGESLAGGGALMSANLLAGYAPRTLNNTTKFTGYQLTPEIDLWTTTAFSASKHADVIAHYTGGGTMPSLATLSSNQTVTATCGVTTATSTSFNASVLRVWLQYADSAGNANWLNLPAVSETVTNGKWTRIGGAGVIPSGMHITGCGLAKYSGAAAFIMTDITLSYGSGLPVAEETFTPFETASHAQTEYATYASQKILSDSITSEVKARAKTDGAVSELSTKMEQTVKGINVSLDSLTATEKQIHSWFDFGSDASGNPKLAMGSSSSPIIGEYSNTGTTYKDRSGATLLALDAANSTTGADHVVSNDVTIGKWQWVPTNGGTHLTLMWRG